MSELSRIISEVSSAKNNVIHANFALMDLKSLFQTLVGGTFKKEDLQYVNERFDVIHKMLNQASNHLFEAEGREDY